MTVSIIKAGAVLALLGALSACTHSAPVWEKTFGQSVRAAVAAQTMHPDAVRNADPVAGIDGRAAFATQKRYEASFHAPVPIQAPITGTDK